MALRLKFKKLHSASVLPQYQSAGAAGFDFVSVEDVEIRPNEVALVPTGLAVEIPEGFEMQIRARSGLALKQGVFLVNGVGTVDSDYRGEIKIIMSTCLANPVTIKKGERVAQGVVTKVEKVAIEESQYLAESARGELGFGSTGR